MARIVQHFMTHVVPGVLKPLRILWNEVIGFLFLVLGGWFANGTLRGYRNLDKTGESPLLLIASGLLSLVLLYYGVTSFLRARKIGRS